MFEVLIIAACLIFFLLNVMQYLWRVRDRLVSFLRILQIVSWKGIVSGLFFVIECLEWLVSCNLLRSPEISREFMTSLCLVTVFLRLTERFLFFNRIFQRHWLSIVQTLLFKQEKINKTNLMMRESDANIKKFWMAIQEHRPWAIKNQLNRKKNRSLPNFVMTY